VPRFELLKLVSSSATLISLSSGNNYIGPFFSFVEDSISTTFSIGKNKNLPDSQLTISFDYSTNAIAGSFSPNISILLNNNFIGVKSFSSSNGSKTVTIDIDNTFLSILNTSITDPNYDLLTFNFTVPGGNPSTSTFISNLSISWITSKTEEFENYESSNGDNVETYSTYDSLPIVWEYNPVETETFNLSYRDNKYYKTYFSGIENEAFDIVSRAILRVTGSNNNSISGVDENPCSIEAYCLNKNTSDLIREYQTQENVLNQEGEVFAWGVSNLISYSGTQSNDIELCFVKNNSSHPFNFSARKYGRDHKSLFTEGDFYLKGLTSGYQINNIELILYEKNDKYLPFSMFGGNTLFSNSTTVISEGYVSSRKLMTQNLEFWNCIPDSGIEESPPPPSGIEEPPPPP
jgi:hypothetical protein